MKGDTVSPNITTPDSSVSIRPHLEKTLASSPFKTSARLCEFLRLTIDYKLTGRQAEISQFLIATQVFKRPAESFDPQIDPIVRVEAARLRAKLREYYATEGIEDAVRIDYPKGSYVPVFVHQSKQDSAAGVSGAAPNYPQGNGAERTRANISIPRRFAVLPFADLSEKHDLAHLGDGAAALLVNRLAQLPGIRVVSQTSSFLYAAKGMDIRRIGKELGADAIIDGALRKLDDQLRVTCQLNDAKSGYTLWSRVFDWRLGNVFAGQEELASTVTGVIRSRSNGGHLKDDSGKPFRSFHYSPPIWAPQFA